MNDAREISLETIHDLCGLFALGALKTYSFSGGTRTGAVVLETERGKWFARQRHGAYSTDAQLRFDHGAAAFLAERGAAVHPPRKTAAGETWWQGEEAVWEVFPFVSGRAMRHGDAGDLSALGRAVGAFHEVGKSFGGSYEKLSPRGETDPSYLLATVAALSAEWPKCADPYEEWIHRGRKALPDAGYAALPSTLVHGDIQPGNVIFDENGVVAFVDLDWVCQRPRLYDIGFILPFCCAIRESPIAADDIWSLTQAYEPRSDLIMAFLDAYNTTTSALTTKEMEALPHQIVLSWCHARVCGALKVPVEERVRFLARPPHTVGDIVGDWPYGYVVPSGGGFR